MVFDKGMAHQKLLTLTSGTPLKKMTLTSHKLYIGTGYILTQVIYCDYIITCLE